MVCSILSEKFYMFLPAWEAMHKMVIVNWEQVPDEPYIMCMWCEWDLSFILRSVIECRINWLPCAQALVSSHLLTQSNKNGTISGHCRVQTFMVNQSNHTTRGGGAEEERRRAVIQTKLPGGGGGRQTQRTQGNPGNSLREHPPFLQGWGKLESTAMQSKMEKGPGGKIQQKKGIQGTSVEVTLFCFIIKDVAIKAMKEYWANGHKSMTPLGVCGKNRH